MPPSGSKSNESQNGVIKATERAGGEGKAAEDQAFANKLAKRSPPQSGRTCRDRKGEKANQSPRATHCHAHWG